MRISLRHSIDGVEFDAYSRKNNKGYSKRNEEEGEEATRKKSKKVMTQSCHKVSLHLFFFSLKSAFS